MDELAHARVELTLLEEKARQLLEQLLDVRATIATQRAKIDELSRASLRPSAINRLPTEILVSILLGLDFCSHDDLERKQELASVCRRWRDVILRTPCFWSTISLASNAVSIIIHLKRSRGAFLDIVIECARPSSPEYLVFLAGLEFVMTFADRWRSLLVTVSDNSSDDNPYDDGEEPLAHFIVDRINHLHFPSLKRVTISAPCDVGYLDFLSIAHAPALEHLELDEFTTVHDILNPVAMLKTLKLDFGMASFTDHLSFWSLVPTQALTKLSIFEVTLLFSLQPNSIYFPSLMSLHMVRVTKARLILDAIVAPNLEQFNYSRSCFDDSLSVTFGGFTKFTNVRQLSFSEAWGVHHSDAMRLCEAFPGVHHVYLVGGDWHFLFDHPPIQSDPKSHIQCPMDFWTELKSLTFHGLHPIWLEHDQLTAWLVHRRASSPQQLHVKVIGSHYSKVVQSIDQRPYERLKENCILKLERFSTMDFSVPGDPSTRGVSSFHKTSSGNSTHLDLL